ncbi:MAG TPA: hypothetical protein VLS27_05480 [Gammaproteobacteria bacterium]|nr:hypothetical protein [Gammaproteobacteria bacterium]
MRIIRKARWVPRVAPESWRKVSSKIPASRLENQLFGSKNKSTFPGRIQSEAREGFLLFEVFRPVQV